VSHRRRESRDYASSRSIASATWRTVLGPRDHLFCNTSCSTMSHLPLRRTLRSPGRKGRNKLVHRWLSRFFGQVHVADSGLQLCAQQDDAPVCVCLRRPI
jgi:hypothetical protein